MIKSQTFEQICILVEEKDVLISSHGYEELAEDHIFVTDVLLSVSDAEVLEDYPDFGKEPCCLVLQKDASGALIHVVWGLAKDTKRPAMLITAYRPSEERWTDGYRRRKNAK